MSQHHATTSRSGPRRKATNSGSTGTGSQPYASPLLAPDLTGLPPAVVCTAEHDSPRDNGERYVERLRRARVPVEHDHTPGVDHYFLTENPTRARATMAMIAAAILRATRP